MYLKNPDLMLYLSVSEHTYILKSIKNMTRIMTYLKSTLNSDFNRIIFEIFIYRKLGGGGGGGDTPLIHKKMERKYNFLKTINITK